MFGCLVLAMLATGCGDDDDGAEQLYGTWNVVNAGAH